MLARFRTWETLLLLVVAVGVIAAGGVAVHLRLRWTAVLAVSFLVLAYAPLAARLQDRLIELYLSRGRFKDALRVAATIRDGARDPTSRALAAFDVGLVHLARGANDDAVRCFRLLEGHRLKERTRMLINIYTSLAVLRAADAEHREEAARALGAAADQASASFADDPYLMAAKGEASLALGQADEASRLLRRSLDMVPDPRDPSPGERHVLYARAALLNGERSSAASSLRIAADLHVDAPFVRAARAELAHLE